MRAISKGRAGLALAIAACLLVIGAGAVWFGVLPHVIESEIRGSLASVTEKTGRTVDVSGIRLTGIWRVQADRIVVSDAGNPERAGVLLTDVGIKVSGVLSGDKAHIDGISVGDADINFRAWTDGKTNFDDLLEYLKPKEKAAESGAKAKSEKWKHWVTPAPELNVDAISIQMKPLRIHETLEVGAVTVSDFKMSQGGEEPPAFAFHGRVSALLVEDGAPTAYESQIEGKFSATDEGFVSLKYPRSSNHEAPHLFHEGGVAAVFDEARLVLPSQFEISGLEIDANGARIVGVERAKIRLMSLPPRKVSGVYFKEIELVRPEISDTVLSDGTLLTGWISALKKRWTPRRAHETVQAGAAKKKSVKDRFFTQRLIVEDGKIAIMDRRENPFFNFKAQDIQVEIGYRSIRKVLDYRIAFEIENPAVSRLVLDGVYDMHKDDTEGSLDIDFVEAGEAMRQLQARLRDSDSWLVPADMALKVAGTAAKLAQNPEMGTEAIVQAAQDIADKKPGILGTAVKKWLPALNLSQAKFGAHVRYHYGLSSQALELESSLTSSGATLQLDEISREPLALDGGIRLKASADLSKKQFSLDSFEILLGNVGIRIGMAFEKLTREIKTRKGRAETRDSWAFKASADLEQQPMQQIFDAIPHALRPELDGLSWTGELGFHFEARGYLDSLSTAQHKFILQTSPDFNVASWPLERDLNALNQGFVHHVNDPNALEPHDIVIPPSIYPITVDNVDVYVPAMTADDIRANYPHWVLFEDLNPWLAQLVTTTEDGSFFTHSGFSPLQIKAALERNLARHGFSRGASTLSMQLIKNLFFDRTKSVARKFQEMIYTWLMESVVRIPKKRIMEIYFNVIEFGPEIYGIEAAAQYYFGKRSRALSLKECAFLMAIIPRPWKGAVYRMQPTLGRDILKTVNFYISEMYRRKCDPQMLEKMRARFARQQQAMPYEPCCPSRDALQLILDNTELAFYVPDPANPQKAGLRPDLYDEHGESLTPTKMSTCGMGGNDDPMESIFETLVPEEMPVKDSLSL